MRAFDTLDSHYRTEIYPLENFKGLIVFLFDKLIDLKFILFLIHLPSVVSLWFYWVLFHRLLRGTSEWAAISSRLVLLFCIPPPYLSSDLSFPTSFFYPIPFYPSSLPFNPSGSSSVQLSAVRGAETIMKRGAQRAVDGHDSRRHAPQLPAHTYF